MRILVTKYWTKNSSYAYKLLSGTDFSWCPTVRLLNLGRLFPGGVCVCDWFLLHVMEDAYGKIKVR